MAAQSYLRLSTSMAPAVPAGSVDTQSFGLEEDAVAVATTDTVARILCTPGEYTVSGTDPYVEFDLKNGSDPGNILSNPVPSSGGTEIAYSIVQRVAGVANDFGKVRAIHIRAFPADGTNPSKIKADIKLGNLAVASSQRMCLPLCYDSADSGSTPASSAHASVPNGLSYSDSYKLILTVYHALNVKVLITILGN